MNSTYLSQVMSPTCIGCGHFEENDTTVRLLTLTNAAINEYKYVTVVFESIQYGYGDGKATVSDKTVFTGLDAHGTDYTVKLSTSNTNWNVYLWQRNDSDYYGCNVGLAVKSIVLSTS